MAVRGDRPYRAVTTLKIVLTGCVVLLVGVMLLYLGGLNITYWQHHEGLQTLTDNLGALLVIAVALGAVWELIGKRAFAREVLESARITAEIEATGLRRVLTNYLDEPDWEELFRRVHRLDIFVAYGQTWRNTNLPRLRRLARRANGRIRVYLPDPSDNLSISMLASRFGHTPEELIKRITNTKTDFEDLREPGGATIEVFYCTGDRLFSFYRFDTTAVMTLYRHKQERSPVVPTLVCEASGSLYEFIRSELETVRSRSRPA